MLTWTICTNTWCHLSRDATVCCCRTIQGSILYESFHQLVTRQWDSSPWWRPGWPSIRTLSPSLWSPSEESCWRHQRREIKPNWRRLLRWYGGSCLITNTEFARWVTIIMETPIICYYFQGLNQLRGRRTNYLSELWTEEESEVSTIGKNWSCHSFSV